MNAPVILDRRRVLAGRRRPDRQLLAARRVRGTGAEAAAGPKLPGSLAQSPYLDSWLRIDADGRITAFTGKAELGQGFRDGVPADRGRTARRRLRCDEGDHRRHQAHGERGLHRRQPLDAGQRHRDPACRGAGARTCWWRRRRGGSNVAGRDVCGPENAAVIAPDGRRLDLWRACCGRYRCMSRRSRRRR